jgi:hypothetical protein
MVGQMSGSGVGMQERRGAHGRGFGKFQARGTLVAAAAERTRYGNLNVPRYMDTVEEEMEIDCAIAGCTMGGSNHEGVILQPAVAQLGSSETRWIYNALSLPHVENIEAEFRAKIAAPGPRGS